MRVSLSIVIAFMTLQAGLSAYSLPPPKEEVFQSENGKYRLHVIPPEMPSSLEWHPDSFYDYLYGEYYSTLFSLIDGLSLDNLVCRAELWSRSDKEGTFFRKWMRPLPNAIAPQYVVLLNNGMSLHFGDYHPGRNDDAMYVYDGLYGRRLARFLWADFEGQIEMDLIKDPNWGFFQVPDFNVFYVYVDSDIEGADDPFSDSPGQDAVYFLELIFDERESSLMLNITESQVQTSEVEGERVNIHRHRWGKPFAEEENAVESEEDAEEDKPKVSAPTF